MLRIYFAPLEGITDAVYRRAHAAHFGGIAKYFIPFVSPTQNLRFTSRELAAVDPAQNAGLFAVPQVLTKEPSQLLWAAQTLYDMGYEEINLNLGCPSGTVTAKGKGAGLLRDLSAVQRLLDAACAHVPGRLSVKTRLGWHDAGEFPALLALLDRYPLREIIVHARTREMFYEGTPHREAFAEAAARAKTPLVYNGDLFTPGDCRTLQASCPQTHALMVGRGLVANPALARELAGGPGLEPSNLRRFIDALLLEWSRLHSPAIARAKVLEVVRYASACFEGSARPFKLLRKARTQAAFDDALDRLFDLPLRALPAYSPAKAPSSAAAAG